ncbi:unnamed protein product [Onchocerca flexuosa]|uniref:Rhoptry associated protein-1 n=1 Tax=Onchocerca flexuosa TaxID=387005 RepID=A0A183HK35_9BILA|nr:unnamed protein product [Onchocerca flexuosa]
MTICVGLPVPVPAAKFANRLKKVLPHTRTKDAVIKPRLLRNAPTAFPYIRRGLERNFNALMDLYSLPIDEMQAKVVQPMAKVHAIQNIEEDDEDLELVMDSDDEKDEKKDDISESSAENGGIKRRLSRFSRKILHDNPYRPESVYLEANYQEDSKFET